MKKNFLIAGEKKNVLYSVFFLHFGCGISAYFIRFSHLFGLQAKDPKRPQADSKDSDQPAWMHVCAPKPAR